MRHRILCVLSSSLATASLAVAPAFATDDGPAAPLQPAPSLGALAPVLSKCTDSTRPSASVTTNALRGHAVRGTARDLGCGVAMVTISIARQHGKRCEFLTAKRRLSKPTRCSGHFVVATGTSRWRVDLPKRLPRGTYVVRTRAIDFAGNVQRQPKHIRRLRVR